MATEETGNKQQKDIKDAAIQPDAETLNTTDPQEHMEGPLSSLMQKAEDVFGSNESREEAEEKKNQ